MTSRPAVSGSGGVTLTAIKRPVRSQYRWQLFTTGV